MNASGLGDYSETFKTNEIDGKSLFDMDHEALRSMDIAVAGKRLKILKTIAALKFASIMPGETPSPEDVAKLLSSVNAAADEKPSADISRNNSSKQINNDDKNNSVSVAI